MNFLFKRKAMAQYKFLVIMLLSCSNIYSQKKITTKYFSGTVWASSNKDSSFFKSDTVKILQVANAHRSNTDDYKDLANYFDNSDFATLQFKQANNLVLFVTKIEAWSVVKKKGQYKWRFNYKNQILQFYFREKVFASFKILYETKIQIKSAYISVKPVSTKELVLQRVYSHR